MSKVVYVCVRARATIKLYECELSSNPRLQSVHMLRSPFELYRCVNVFVVFVVVAVVDVFSL